MQPGELGVRVVADLDLEHYYGVGEAPAEGEILLVVDADATEGAALPSQQPETGYAVAIPVTAIEPEFETANQNPDDEIRDEQLEWLYTTHYHMLFRLARLLVRSTEAAEDVVSEVFVKLIGVTTLRDPEKLLAYARQAVVNRSRSVLRHQSVVDKKPQLPPPDGESAEGRAITLWERESVIDALRNLPGRQREAIVLRYYADLPEAEIARTMGISRGAVKSHTARGMVKLREEFASQEGTPA